MMPDLTIEELIEIHEECCYTCDHCCCDNYDEEDNSARFWCDMKNIPEMNKTGAINCDCENWIILNNN